MRFVVAGGGPAGLSAALALSRAGHEAVVVERDAVESSDDPRGAFDVPRRGIPHFLQPHAFIPRGRKVLRAVAPDVMDAVIEAGAEEQDLAERLRGPHRPGDEDMVFVWVRRPVIEWALRRAAAAEAGVRLLAGRTVTGLLTDPEGGAARGVVLEGGETVEGDVVVDALGRYRPPAGWPRAVGEPTDCGGVYYSRYFRLVDGATRPDGPWLLNPRGELGYLSWNTFRGDDRTFSITFLAPTHDRELRALRDEDAFMAACEAIRPIDAMTAPENARPVTDVLPMGGLANVMRAGRPSVRRVVAVGDAVCHTNPAYAFGLSFALAQAEALARAAVDHAGDADALVDAYAQAIEPEARERHAMAVATDAERVRMSRGERLDIGHRDGSYPLFAFAAAGAAAPFDDHVLRRTIGRVGLLDRTAVFDDDAELHDRIERIFAELSARPRPPAGPSREELLDLMTGREAA